MLSKSYFPIEKVTSQELLWDSSAFHILLPHEITWVPQEAWRDSTAFEILLPWCKKRSPPHTKVESPQESLRDSTAFEILLPSYKKRSPPHTKVESPFEILLPSYKKRCLVPSGANSRHKVSGMSEALTVSNICIYEAVWSIGRKVKSVGVERILKHPLCTTWPLGLGYRETFRSEKQSQSGSGTDTKMADKKMIFVILYFHFVEFLRPQSTVWLEIIPKLASGGRKR